MWTLVEIKTVAGQNLIFEGQFIIATVTRREDAEEIVWLHNRELEPSDD